MEIKRITLHPLLSDGTIDLNVNLYPKSLLDGIVDREGNPVDIATDEELQAKQDVLVSGESIKTINGDSVLGSGDVSITKESIGLGNVDDTSDLDKPMSDATKAYVDEAIESIEIQSDVIDVVGTYQDLQDYDTSSVKLNDLIKVINDETHNNAISYYRWESVSDVDQWVFVASEGPFYTKSEADALLDGKVSLTGNQTIYGVKTIDTDNQSELYGHAKLVIKAHNWTPGTTHNFSIEGGSNGAYLFLKYENSSVASLTTDSSLSFYPNVTIGRYSAPKNLTIYGNLTDGTNSIAVAQIANKDSLTNYVPWSSVSSSDSVNTIVQRDGNGEIHSATISGANIWGSTIHFNGLATYSDDGISVDSFGNIKIKRNNTSDAFSISTGDNTNLIKVKNNKELELGANNHLNVNANGTIAVGSYWDLGSTAPFHIGNGSDADNRHDLLSISNDGIWFGFPDHEVWASAATIDEKLTTSYASIDYVNNKRNYTFTSLETAEAGGIRFDEYGNIHLKQNAQAFNIANASNAPLVAVSQTGVKAFNSRGEGLEVTQGDTWCDIATVGSNTHFVDANAPTYSTHLTNKQYVDGIFSRISGYDASKTQVLKNIYGTLTWVDE